MGNQSVTSRSILKFLSAAAVVSSLGVAHANAVGTPSDFRDFVIAVYETAITLRSLPKGTDSADYDRLISECRYHLYKAMSSAAASGTWDDVKHIIPQAETCSRTGKVRPQTVQEYQDHWKDAERLASGTTPSSNPPRQASQAPRSPQQQNPDASNERIVRQEQPCYMGVPCRVTVERPKPQNQRATSQPAPQGETRTASTVEELTAAKNQILARSPRTRTSFDACEKSMKYPMEVSLISNRLKFTKEQLSAYQTEMSDKSLRSCVCIIQKIEPALDNKEAEDYYSAVLENYHSNRIQFNVYAAARGFDERKLVATISSVKDVISQCPRVE